MSLYSRRVEHAYSIYLSVCLSIHLFFMHQISWTARYEDLSLPGDSTLLLM